MKLDVYICACAILVSARNGAPSARLRPASCLRRQPIARVHGQHPSGPDFVSAAGGRGPGIAEPAPAPPACQGRCARACKTPAHQPPPACASTNNPLVCAIARTNIGRIRTRARVHVHQMHPRVRASRIRFPINIAPGHVPVPGPASVANNPGPGSARPRRPRGLLWQNRAPQANFLPFLLSATASGKNAAIP